MQKLQEKTGKGAFLPPTPFWIGLKLFGAKRLIKTVKVLSASIKWINPIQKYPHIMESYACILKTFGTTIDLSINILISFGIWATLKLSK